jgi:hypothetical protein
MVTSVLLSGVSCSTKMALTKEFRETVYRRAQRDAAFRKAMLTEAVNAYLGGDEATGKAALRDVINATIGFEQLAAAVRKPSKSLHRMLGPRGNPNTANFFHPSGTAGKNRRDIEGPGELSGSGIPGGLRSFRRGHLRQRSPSQITGQTDRLRGRGLPTGM